MRLKLRQISRPFARLFDVQFPLLSRLLFDQETFASSNRLQCVTLIRMRQRMLLLLRFILLLDIVCFFRGDRVIWTLHFETVNLLVNEANSAHRHSAAAFATQWTVECEASFRGPLV